MSNLKVKKITKSYYQEEDDRTMGGFSFDVVLNDNSKMSIDSSYTSFDGLCDLELVIGDQKLESHQITDDLKDYLYDYICEVKRDKEKALKLLSENLDKWLA